MQYTKHIFSTQKLAILIRRVTSLEARFSVSSMWIPSSYSSCYTLRHADVITELGTKGGWSCKLADNFGLDRGGSNELFRVTEQESDTMKAVFKED